MLGGFEQGKAFDGRGGLEELATGAEKLNFIFLDKPNDQVPIALKFATAE